MDVIKKLWNTVFQYRFWILSVLVFIMASVVFFICNSKLAADIAARTKNLDETFDKIKTVSAAVPTHPNLHSHAQMDKGIRVLEKDILEAWHRQYQRQIPLMVWPKGAFHSESTREIFNKLRPVEKYIDFPLPTPMPQPYARITPNDRAVYKQYIGPEFKSVSKRIGTQWKAQLGAGGASGYAGGMPGGGDMAGMSGMPGSGGGYPGGDGGGFQGATVGMTSNVPDLVRWSVASQQALLAQVAPWYSRPSVPSILEIYYTQEDMWLLTGIMQIIEKTNGDARENFETVVREIEWIRMGRTASRNAGVLTRMQSSMAAGAGGYGASGFGGEGGGDGMGAMGMGGDGGMGMSSGDGGMGMGGMSSEGGMGGEGGMGTMTARDPADGRYISFAAESEFQPRLGEELRTAIRGINSTNAVDAVAKRVPVRLRLKVDPSRLYRLLAECANADLLLEVYQVRLNTDPAPASGMGGGGGGGYSGGGGYGGGMDGGMPGGGDMAGMSGMGGMSGGDGGMPGMGMGGMGGGMGMGGSEGGYGGSGGYGTQSGFGSPDAMSEISVEIFGLFYLYNPDDPTALGSVLAAGNSSDAATADPAASAPAKVEN